MNYVPAVTTAEANLRKFALSTQLDFIANEKAEAIIAKGPFFA
jgi:hypothetical protein